MPTSGVNLLVIAQFDSRRDTIPKHESMDWDTLAGRLSTHLEVGAKDRAPLWSPARFLPGTTRAKANVVSVGVLACDLDDGTPPDQVRQWLDGLEFLIHSTFSHSDEQPRLRAVIQLVEPIPAADYDQVWRQVNRELFGGHLDPSTRDSSRMSYWPSRPPGGASPVVVHGRGEPLDWHALEPLPVLEHRRGHLPRPASDHPARRRAEGMLEKWTRRLAEVQPHTGRHWQLLRFAYAAGGLIPDGYLTTAAVRAALLEACEANQLIADDGPSNVLRTIDDGLREGGLEPWSPADLGDSPTWSSRSGLSTPLGSRGVNRQNGHTSLEPAAKAAARAVEGHRPLTDLGNAERLIDAHGQDLRYCFALHRWLVWDGLIWGDHPERVEQLAASVVRAIQQVEANDPSLSRKDRGRIFTHGLRSEAHARIKAMIDLARSLPGVAIATEDLDRDPWLLGVGNGTVDLRLGQLQAPRREDLLTRMTSVLFDATARCPTWDAFLAETFGGAQDLVDFVRRAVGYTLVGVGHERVLFVVYGPPRSGKTTFLETLGHVLGPYATSSSQIILLVSYDTRERDIALAQLQPPMRFVYVAETGEGRRFDENFVKKLTGDDTVPARGLYVSPFRYLPTFTLWLGTNNRPTADDSSGALWDRLRPIPFAHRVDDEHVQRGLIQQLHNEAPGILRWAVESALLWQRDGLGMPPAIVEALHDYRSTQRGLEQFLVEECIFNDGLSASGASLTAAYHAWAQNEGHKPRHPRVVAQALRARGCGSHLDHYGRTLWTGVMLRQSPPSSVLLGGR